MLDFGVGERRGRLAESLRGGLETILHRLERRRLSHDRPLADQAHQEVSSCRDLHRLIEIRQLSNPFNDGAVLLVHHGEQRIDLRAQLVAFGNRFLERAQIGFEPLR